MTPGEKLRMRRVTNIDLVTLGGRSPRWKKGGEDGAGGAGGIMGLSKSWKNQETDPPPGASRGPALALLSA